MSLQVQQRYRCWRNLICYKNLCVITNDEASANVLAVDAQLEAVGQPVRCWRLFALNYLVSLFVLIKQIDEEADCRRVGTSHRLFTTIIKTTYNCRAASIPSYVSSALRRVFPRTR